jgi:hypothetical protein
MIGMEVNDEMYAAKERREGHSRIHVKRGETLAQVLERGRLERDGAFVLTPLQAEALRKASRSLLDGDLKGAEGYLNHVALYPILRREDDLSAFVQSLHAYVQKLIAVFRCGGCS